MRKLLTGVAIGLLLFSSSAFGAASRRGSDPYREAQWGLDMINAPAAWETTRGKGAVIAVLDTGVDRTHPDLATKMVRTFFDPCDGQGLEPGDHGTHVAGVAAAATGNSIGVAGVAPDARIMDVKVLGGGCPDRNLAAGIRFAVDAGVEVINASLAYDQVETLATAGGLSDGIRDVRAALRYASKKGVVVVGSAGNSALPFCAEPWHKEVVICVGAVNELGHTTYYSNFDATSASNFVRAPGGQAGPGGRLGCESFVVSTIRTDQTGALHCGTVLDPGYGPMSGTSMAAPHVSGVAALLAGKGLTGRQIVRCILETAVDLGPTGRDPVYGHGLVDAEAAVTRCRR